MGGACALREDGRMNVLTRLNCHAATSGFHQGLWERQQVGQRGVQTLSASSHTSLHTGGLKVAWREGGQSEPGWGTVGGGTKGRSHAWYSRGVGVCSGGDGTRGRRLEDLRVHHDVKLT